MVRIPVYDSPDRSVGTGAEFMRPYSSEAAERDISRGLGAIDNSLDLAASLAHRRAERDDKFMAEKNLLDLEDRARSIARDAQQNIPETGRGFHDQTMGLIQSEAQKTLDAMPASQRQAMETSIQRFLNSQSDQLANVEITQNRNFIKDVTKRHLERLATNVTTGTWDVATATAENDRFLSGMGGTPEMTAIFRQNFQRATEASRLEYLRQTNPAEFLRQAQRFQGNYAAPGASNIQRLIVEQARIRNMDPHLALTIGQLESGFNPNATNSQTIQGLFQMTRSTRERLAGMLGADPNNMNDPALQVAGLSILMREAQTRLEANGIPVTAANLWSNHFLGPAGATAFLNADRNANAYDVYRSVAGQRIADQAFSQNPGLLERGFTVGDVLGRINRRVDEAQNATRGLLVADPASPPNAPIGEFMGERFQVATPADLAAPIAQARDQVDKDIGRQINAASRVQADTAVVGNAYDAAWRKAQDDLAVSENAQQQILTGDRDAITRWTSFADRFGYLPQSVTSAVRTMLGSSDRAQQITGYELGARVLRHNPIDGLRLSHFGGDSDAQGANHAAMIRDYVALTTHANMDPGEAVRRVQLTHSSDWQQRSKDKDFADRLEREARARNWGEIAGRLGMYAGWPRWMLGSGAPNTEPVNPDVRQRMEEMYQDFFRFHYRERGETELARSRALGDVERAFGATRMLGTSGSRMPYPPEQTYPPMEALPTTTDASGRTVTMRPGELTNEQFQTRYGYIADQALAVARMHAQAQKDPGADTLSANDVFLVPTTATRQAVTRFEIPSYRLVYRSQRNGMVTVVEDWRADPNAARERRNRETENDPPPAAIVPRPEVRNREDAFRSKRGQ